MDRVLALLLLVAVSASCALKAQVYDEYSDDHEEGNSGQWSSLQSDHSGKGLGEKQHNHHFYRNTGDEAEGSKKAGGHYKHQVTKGYQNYHHKDEVGKTTSYIDTDEDSGDHYGGHGGQSTWGDHRHGGVHRNHYTSGQRGVDGFNVKERKESTSKKAQKKDTYKGDIADVLYAKKPATYSEYQSKVLYPRVPYQYYFY